MDTYDIIEMQIEIMNFTIDRLESAIKNNNLAEVKLRTADLQTCIDQIRQLLGL